MLHLALHPEWHAVFETLGYTLGFAACKRQISRTGDVINQHERWTIIAAAIIGALVGSRVLGIWESTPLTQITIAKLLTPGSGGKTIVGGLLGGWLAVELIKKVKGIESRTGDVFAIPLCIGIAIGRIGCLLAGLSDDTYGKPTSLPWGVDFGDGIARHPTQAYEIGFLIVLALILNFYARHPHANGALFRIFMTAYVSWRMLIDFLKPERLIAGLSILQWSCLAGLLALFLARLRESDPHSNV